jgi:hypothetical protein
MWMALMILAKWGISSLHYGYGPTRGCSQSDTLTRARTCAKTTSH